VKVKILPTALEDLDRGRLFYARQRKSLGNYFLDALFSDIDSLELYAGIHITYSATIFPHFIAEGRVHLPQGEPSIRAVHFTFEDADSIFHDFDASDRFWMRHRSLKQSLLRRRSNTVGRSILGQPRRSPISQGGTSLSKSIRYLERYAPRIARRLRWVAHEVYESTIRFLSASSRTNRPLLARQ
jgi:hypothetical protein